MTSRSAYCYEGYHDHCKGESDAYRAAYGGCSCSCHWLPPDASDRVRDDRRCSQCGNSIDPATGICRTHSPLPKGTAE